MNTKISLSELAEEMTKGIVKFSYTKKDGTLRLAYGTRNESILSANNAPMGTRPSPSSVFTYFDTEVGGWRCFKRDLNEEGVVRFAQ